METFILSAWFVKLWLMRSNSEKVIVYMHWYKKLQQFSSYLYSLDVFIPEWTKPITAKLVELIDNLCQIQYCPFARITSI